MSFDLKKFFGEVFRPEPGETLTIMYDLPHGDIIDTVEWKQRREMAIDWHNKINEFADYYQTSVNPLVTYLSTGSHNGDLPEKAQIGGEECILEDIIAQYPYYQLHYQVRFQECFCRTRFWGRRSTSLLAG